VAGLCGLPAERIIDSDPIERELWLRACVKASEMRAQMIKAEASHVGYYVAKALAGKRG
jgi:hypothetical protein